MSEIAAERAIRLSVAAAGRRGTIDPLFRRRLRGRVLNRYVAAREGVALTAAGGRRMGRIGRASLYASVALALSVSGVMAASRASVPGDLLYPIKRQLEQIRAEVLPAHFRDELAADAFAQRVTELGRLVESGDLSRASALLPDVRDSLEMLAVLRPDHGSEPVVTRQLSILASLLERLPEGARAAIERALDHAPGLVQGGPTGEVHSVGQPSDRMGGADRQKRDGPDRGHRDEAGSPGGGAAEDDSDAVGPVRSGRGPSESGPKATPAATPAPAVEAEPEDESD